MKCIGAQRDLDSSSRKMCLEIRGFPGRNKSISRVSLVLNGMDTSSTYMLDLCAPVPLVNVSKAFLCCPAKVPQVRPAGRSEARPLFILFLTVP